MRLLIPRGCSLILGCTGSCCWTGYGFLVSLSGYAVLVTSVLNRDRTCTKQGMVLRGERLYVALTGHYIHTHVVIDEHQTIFGTRMLSLHVAAVSFNLKSGLLFTVHVYRHYDTMTGFLKRTKHDFSDYNGLLNSLKVLLTCRVSRSFPMGVGFLEYFCPKQVHDFDPWASPYPNTFPLS